MKIKFEFLFLLFIAGSILSTNAQAKHALIVAIGNYPKVGGWPQISSLRDAAFIKQTLLNQGFKESNIKTLTDASATVKGIEGAITGLINDVHPGDIALIHFSSHGEQVEDDNGDETDGKDETVVTYNAIAPSRANIKDYKINQAQYFRDDLFGSLIDKLRNKLGKNGDIVVFMDLCHSGTGTRGVAKVRGDQPPLVSESFDANKYPKADSSGEFLETGASSGDEQQLATYVVFSAARAEELDFETTDDHNEGMGSLSYAVCKAFENLDTGTTYRSLFAKIQTIMSEKAPGQHPVLEGNGIDRMLFGGNIVQQKSFIEVESIKGNQIKIKAGLFAGLDSGAKVALYPAGTIDPKKGNIISSGMVIKADSYTSTVQLEKAIDGKEVPSLWVFVTEPVYRITPIVLDFQSKSRGSSSGFSESEIKSLKGALLNSPIIQFSGQSELTFVKGEAKDSLKVTSNGYLFTTLDGADFNPDELKKDIERYAQYKFLLALEIKDPQADIDVKIVPVINGKPDISRINSNNVNGINEIKDGDSIVLLAKNKTGAPVYFNVLDLQPDGIINPLFPLKEKNIYPSDLRIEGNSSYLFDKYYITISPPYGMETFKVFASRKEIDMERIAKSRGTESRGDFSALSKLVKNSYDIGARGGSSENVSNGDGSVKNLQFRIIPKK